MDYYKDRMKVVDAVHRIMKRQQDFNIDNLTLELTCNHAVGDTLILNTIKKAIKVYNKGKIIDDMVVFEKEVKT